MMFYFLGGVSRILSKIDRKFGSKKGPLKGPFIINNRGDYLVSKYCL